MYEVDFDDTQNRACRDKYLAKHPGVCEQIYLGDQSNKDFLNKVVSQSGAHFDIIIDDGGHKWVLQRPSFEVLWSHVEPGGLYIVEVRVLLLLSITLVGNVFALMDHLASTTRLPRTWTQKTGKKG